MCLYTTLSRLVLVFRQLYASAGNSLPLAPNDAVGMREFLDQRPLLVAEYLAGVAEVADGRPRALLRRSRHEINGRLYFRSHAPREGLPGLGTQEVLRTRQLPTQKKGPIGRQLGHSLARIGQSGGERDRV